MNYYLYLIFLFSLSIISLFVLGLHYILDGLSAGTKQKLTLLKIGMLMIALGPIFYGFLRYFSLQAIEITLPATLGGQISGHAVQAVSAVSQIQWPLYIFAGYCIGFFVMLSRILFSYIGAKKQLAGSTPTKIHGYSVFLNKNIQSPLSFGLPVANIYLPADAESRWTPREIQLSLAHEKSHVNHCDSIWKLISLIVQAMIFFVPWSYTLHKKLELEMEIYCDERTCAETGANIKEYGSLLLAMICSQPKNLIFTNLTDSTLKRRLIAMKSKRIKRPFLISIFSAAIITAGSAAIAMASGISDKNTVFEVSTKVYIDGKLTSSPHLKVQADQKAVIVMGDQTSVKNNQFSATGHVLRIETIASNMTRSGSQDPINMRFDVQYQDGKENIHFKPHLIVAPHQEGTVSFSSDSGHLYELRVIAERV